MPALALLALLAALASSSALALRLPLRMRTTFETPSSPLDAAAQVT